MRTGLLVLGSLHTLNTCYVLSHRKKIKIKIKKITQIVKLSKELNNYENLHNLNGEEANSRGN